VAIWKRSPLGRDYRRLWIANAISVTGDGVTVTAGPLLAAGITHDPLLVAGALFAQQLPWLIFPLLSGVLVDRLEPGRLMVIVDLLQAAAIGGLAASVLAGLAGVQLVGADLVGPPLGAYLFVLTAGLPFVFDAATFVAGAALVGLIIECATHVSLALTRRPWVAALTLVVFGVHNGVWNVVTVTLRQTAVPERLRGRVNSVYFTFSIGGFAVGSLTGGLLARGFGLTAPFWLAAGAIAVVAVLAWRLFTPGRIATDATACARLSPEAPGVGLRAERRSDLSVDTVLAQERRDPGRVDQHSSTSPCRAWTGARKARIPGAHAAAWNPKPR